MADLSMDADGDVRMRTPELQPQTPTSSAAKRRFDEDYAELMAQTPNYSDISTLSPASPRIAARVAYYRRTLEKQPRSIIRPRVLNPNSNRARLLATQARRTGLVIPPREPLRRRIGGMFVSIYQHACTCFAFFWLCAIVAGWAQPPSEIIAVETDATGRKRRAVEATFSSSSPSSPLSPSFSTLSSAIVTPGQFPGSFPAVEQSLSEIKPAQDEEKRDTPMADMPGQIPGSFPVVEQSLSEVKPAQDEKKRNTPMADMPGTMSTIPKETAQNVSRQDTAHQETVAPTRTLAAPPSSSSRTVNDDCTVPIGPGAAAQDFPRQDAAHDETVAPTRKLPPANASFRRRVSHDWKPKEGAPRLVVRRLGDRSLPPSQPVSPQTSRSGPLKEATTAQNTPGQPAPQSSASRPASGSARGKQPIRERRTSGTLVTSRPSKPRNALARLSRALGITRPSNATTTPAQKNAQRDAEVDALITKTKKAVLESPEDRAFRESFKARKQQEIKAAEAARQAEEEAARQAEEEAAREAEESARQAEEEAARQAEEATRQKATDDAADKRLIKPLEAAWEERVSQAMATKTMSHVIATTADGTNLTRHDFGSLLPQAGAGDNMSGWLNDEIVNGWMSSIVNRKLEQTKYKKGPKTVPAFAAFPSMWYTNYKNKGMASIATWSRRKGIKGEKLLQCEKIFFPVNTGNHWTLIIISPKARTIEYLDSLRGYPSKSFAIAREWLSMELEEAFKPDEWTNLDSHSVLQTNSDDCGVFTCFNALAGAKGRTFGELQPSPKEGADMQAARKIMAAVLINGGLRGDWEL